MAQLQKKLLPMFLVHLLAWLGQPFFLYILLIYISNNLELFALLNFSRHFLVCIMSLRNCLFFQLKRLSDYRLSYNWDHEDWILSLKCRWTLSPPIMCVRRPAQRQIAKSSKGPLTKSSKGRAKKCQVSFNTYKYKFMVGPEIVTLFRRGESSTTRYGKDFIPMISAVWKPDKSLSLWLAQCSVADSLCFHVLMFQIL